MAKKTVAGYRDKSKAKTFTKVVRAVKNPETGAYSYKEDIVPTDMVKDFLKDNK
ncbi:DUF4295 domain-containing protein [Pontibacter sp. G13]|uniref:DUF4295 domain-containing protein n=1 Tax=Pontibacter sp. G13 TaxID=3074898 RepID=UPI00288AC3C8|nr:DUF4295 domain-containing protein [Pontibacter sp. G13]WNJ18494.1 DUF4295 domain-containing protein [Pontibacter sp. G13]